MDLQHALREGPNFVRNAEDATKRNITNAEMLYVWDNQVAAIDGYLADTETMAGDSEELSGIRAQLRDLKKQLEGKLVAFEAEQEGEEVPEEPPAEELIEDFKGFGSDIVMMADEALANEITNVKDLVQYEDPRDLINGYLADSEPYAAADKDLTAVREEVRKRKVELDTRIKSVEEEWRAADLAAGS